jgi:hypothetical protein
MLNVLAYLLALAFIILILLCENSTLWVHAVRICNFLPCLNPNNWPRNFLRQRTKPVVVGWFAGRACKNNKWYTELPKLLWSLCSICTVTNVTAGRGLEIHGPNSYYFQRPVRRYAQSRREPVNLPKETKFCTHTKKMWNCGDHDWSTMHTKRRSVGYFRIRRTIRRRVTSRPSRQQSSLHHENLQYYR